MKAEKAANRSSTWPLLCWQLTLDFVYLAAFPLIFLYILVVSRCFVRPKIRRGLLQKMGGVPVREGDERAFWVHAVSVGEVLTALPLINALKQRYPTGDLSVSVTTFTGFDLARKKLPGTTVFYAPIDLSLAVARAFRRRRPTVVVLVELELWPNFLLTARRRGVPVYVANGRMTERSCGRYALGGRLTRRFFGLVDSYGLQNESYRERFLRVGVEPTRIEVLGNLKHDREPSPLAARGDEVRGTLGWEAERAVVLTAGSTHPGEEEILCRLYRELRKDEPRLRLILALRHVERLSASGGSPDWGGEDNIVRWSHIRDQTLEGGGSVSVHAGEAILLVDTIGELELFYSVADIVFVGGSLVPHGGHNLFEAASLGRPVLFGPHFENFLEEGKLLEREEAALCVGDSKALASAIRRLIAEPQERKRMGERGLGLVSRLRGATQRHAEWLERQMQLSLYPPD